MRSLDRIKGGRVPKMSNELRSVWLTHQQFRSLVDYARAYGMCVSPHGRDAENFAAKTSQATSKERERERK